MPPGVLMLWNSLECCIHNYEQQRRKFKAILHLEFYSFFALVFQQLASCCVNYRRIGPSGSLIAKCNKVSNLVCLYCCSICILERLAPIDLLYVKEVYNDIQLHSRGWGRQEILAGNLHAGSTHVYMLTPKCKSQVLSPKVS